MNQTTQLSVAGYTAASYSPCVAPELGDNLSYAGETAFESRKMMKKTKTALCSTRASATQPPSFSRALYNTRQMHLDYFNMKTSVGLI